MEHLSPGYGVYYIVLYVHCHSAHIAYTQCIQNCIISLGRPHIHRQNYNLCAQSKKNALNAIIHAWHSMNVCVKYIESMRATEIGRDCVCSRCIWQICTSDEINRIAVKIYTIRCSISITSSLATYGLNTSASQMHRLILKYHPKKDALAIKNQQSPHTHSGTVSLSTDTANNLVQRILFRTHKNILKQQKLKKK